MVHYLALLRAIGDLPRLTAPYALASLEMIATSPVAADSIMELYTPIPGKSSIAFDVTFATDGGIMQKGKRLFDAAPCPSPDAGAIH